MSFWGIPGRVGTSKCATVLVSECLPEKTGNPAPAGMGKRPLFSLGWPLWTRKSQVSPLDLPCVAFCLQTRNVQVPPRPSPPNFFFVDRRNVLHLLKRFLVFVREEIPLCLEISPQTYMKMLQGGTFERNPDTPEGSPMNVQTPCKNLGKALFPGTPHPGPRDLTFPKRFSDAQSVSALPPHYSKNNERKIRDCVENTRASF